MKWTHTVQCDDVWHRWFAWYPVNWYWREKGLFHTTWVWREWVERRKAPYHDMCGEIDGPIYLWEYREPVA